MEMKKKVEKSHPQSKKIKVRKNANLSQLWNFTLFMVRFLNFFFNFMSQEYQNEKSPILNGQKKPKTLRKVQKMTVLQAWEIYKMFANTR